MKKEVVDLDTMRAETAALIARIDLGLVSKFGEVIFSAAESGKTVYAIGNGGSAALASHFVTDLLHISQSKSTNLRLKAHALASDDSMITAFANDYGYEEIFSRQLEVLSEAGDVIVAVSTSGKSRNILTALAAPRTARSKRLGLTSAQGTEMASLCDHSLLVESDSPYVVETVHVCFTQLVAAAIRSRVNMRAPNLKQ